MGMFLGINSANYRYKNLLYLSKKCVLNPGKKDINKGLLKAIYRQNRPKIIVKINHKSEIQKDNFRQYVIIICRITKQ